MLVTNPLQRATLAEVLSHPWMIRSFGGPPDPYLMPREPLTVLDPAVIREMTGFDFGTPDQIHAHLVQVMTGDEYRAAVEYWNMRNTEQFKIHSNPDTMDISAIPLIPGTGTTAAVGPPAPKSRLKRLVRLVLYREKNLASSSPKPSTLEPDPTSQFHPLVSIYYLVRERMERERIYGRGVFASSQLSLGGELRVQQSARKRDDPPNKSASNPRESPQPLPIAEPDDVSSTGPQGSLIDKITSLMTISEVVSCLTAQGCENVTNQLDLGACSRYPISNGGFGDIYQGKLNCGTAIAIRTMRVYVDTDRENRKRFKAKLYTWSKCQHRNVQRLLGLAEFRGQIAMVSVWETNGNLSEYLRLHPDVDRCQLSAQIAESLAYLHEANIVSTLLPFSDPSTHLTARLKVHGDLKASNVLVSRDGVPLLADFGNATLQGCTLNFTSTSTKTAVSMRWAAPELLEGTETHSTPADVYALGMETITGSLPWSGRTEQAIMVATIIKKEYPERPKNQVLDGCEHGDILWDTLTRCWVYDPKNRPSATEVKDIMQEITCEGLMQTRYPRISISPRVEVLQ